MKVHLKLFFKWGIEFDEEHPYVVPENGNRRVQYAEKEEIQQGIMEKYHPESIFDAPPVSEKANNGGNPHGDEQKNIFDEGITRTEVNERRKQMGGHLVTIREEYNDENNSNFYIKVNDCASDRITDSCVSVCPCFRL